MLFPQILDVSDKGEILIPVKIREALGIKPKGKVFLYPQIEEKKAEIESCPENIIEATYGMLASKDGRLWTKELLEERKRDLKREEIKSEFFIKKQTSKKKTADGKNYL